MKANVNAKECQHTINDIKEIDYKNVNNKKQLIVCKANANNYEIRVMNVRMPANFVL